MVTFLSVVEEEIWKESGYFNIELKTISQVSRELLVPLKNKVE
jgi:hypothetical protein